MKPVAGLLILGAACVPVDQWPAPPEADLSFWIRVGEEGQLVGEPSEPLWADEAVPAASRGVGAVLTRIGMEATPLERKYRTTRPLLQSSIALGAGSAESLGCGGEGFVFEDGIEVALSQVEHDSVTYDPDTRRFVPASTPEGLTLRFRQSACPDASSLRLRPFAATTLVRRCALDSCSFTTLEYLTDDVVLGALDGEIDVIDRAILEPVGRPRLDLAAHLSPADGRAWVVYDLLVLRGDWPREDAIVLAAASLDEYGSTPSGAALVRFSVRPSGDIAEVTVLHESVLPSGQRRSLRGMAHLPAGGFVAMGMGLVVTATSAFAPLVEMEPPTFNAHYIQPIPGRPGHFVALSSGRQIYEGDPTQPITTDDVYSLMMDGISTAYGLDTLEVDGELRVVLGTSDGTFWQRVGPRDWRPLPTYLGPGGEACAAAAFSCGRPAPRKDLGSVFGLGPRRDHLVYSISLCTGIFARLPGESCSVPVPIEGEHIQLGQLGSPVAAASRGSRAAFSVVAESGVALYELELVP